MGSSERTPKELPWPSLSKPSPNLPKGEGNVRAWQICDMRPLRRQELHKNSEELQKNSSERTPKELPWPSLSKPSPSLAKGEGNVRAWQICDMRPLRQQELHK